MTSIRNVNQPIQTQQTVVVNDIPQNVRRINFKAENDSFTKQKTPVYTQPPMLDQQAAMRRAIEEQKKAQKNQKLKQNISWAAGILSAAAIIAMVAINFRSMRGTAADENLIKIIREKLAKVKDPAIKEQIRQELAMAPHERNLTRAENLIKLDELAQTTTGRAKTDIASLKQGLDEKIFGVESAKAELMTAVKEMNFDIEHGRVDGKPLILIFDGAPGTSKTTLAKRYADASGMYFKKIPCGGIGDAQEIIGFKRTYVGSIPGSIAQAQIESGTKRVCYCLDEIDRVTKKEVLDALLAPFDDQALFIDQHYCSPIDLSQSVFAMTTNDFTRLPEALKNRAKIIHIKDFTPEEKAGIAKLQLKDLFKEHNVEQYVEGIDDEIYKNIVARTDDKGGRQVTKLVQELIQKIKARQQDGNISTTQKVKINNAFLDEIKLGENMQEAARIEAERAQSMEWRMNNL